MFRAVIDGLAQRLCQGHLRNPLWWRDAYLGRVAGGVLVVCWGGVWRGTATAPAAPATTGGPGWVWRSHGTLPVYGRDRRVCDCVTNCVTITTDDHGLRWLLGDG